ncbi:hypothetical protein ABPG72_018614 [Tetrahymena utriculariae]
MSQDLQQPLNTNEQTPQINQNQYQEQPYQQQHQLQPPYQQQPNYQQQQPPYQQQPNYQQQQPPDQQQPNYPQVLGNQYQYRQSIPSEFKQNQQQIDDPQNPAIQQGDSMPQIKDIDQWARIVPCFLLGLSTTIIVSVFMVNCTQTSPSVYISSAVVLMIVPLILYKWDVSSKFMNFIGSLISMYYMIVLAVYVDKQKDYVIDDDLYYLNECIKENSTTEYKGISYGLVNLLGLSMCLLHTVNMAYYFCQIWILSKHPLKQKIEDYTIELI